MTTKELIKVNRQYILKNQIYCPPQFGSSAIEYDNEYNLIKIIESKNITYRWYLLSCYYIYYALLDEEEKPSAQIINNCEIIYKKLRNIIDCDKAKYFNLDRHATSLRTISLTLLYKYNQCDSLKQFLDYHANFIMNDENYDFGWNHGFDADRALLMVGFELDNKKYIDFALKRLERNITAMVDENGVTTEQAINYQKYNYDLLLLVKKILHKNSNTTLNNLLKRSDLMPDFLAHATLPNGFYLPIGDTFPETKAIPYPHTSAQYAATGGKKGNKPKSNMGIYKKSGFIFGRSGWGEKQSFLYESFYSIRFGPGRYCHGHNDHMSFTYYTLGKEIFIDPGFSGYENEKMRKIFQHPVSHNVAFINDNRKFNWQDQTDLIFYKSYPYLTTNYIFKDIPYKNITRKRSILFNLNKNIIIVLDNILNARDCMVSQIFHLNSHAKVLDLTQDSVSFDVSGTNIYIKQLYPIDNIIPFKGNLNNCFFSYSVKNNSQVLESYSCLTQRASINSGITSFLTIIYISNERSDIVYSQQQLQNARLVNILNNKKVAFSFYILKNSKIVPRYK